LTVLEAEGATTPQEANAEFATISKILQEAYPDTNQPRPLVRKTAVEAGTWLCPKRMVVLVGLVLIACVTGEPDDRERQPERDRVQVGASRHEYRPLTGELLLALSEWLALISLMPASGTVDYRDWFIGDANLLGHPVGPAGSTRLLSSCQS
jgi:hypothetical protein